MRRLFAITLVLVAVCGKPPAEPSQLPVTLAPVTSADFSGADEDEDVVEMTLTVNGSGGAASATFTRGGTRIPLHGSLNGRGLDASGETTNPQSGGDTLDRITSWRASLDEFGRMSGTFHLEDLYRVVSARLGGPADASWCS